MRPVTKTTITLHDAVTYLNGLLALDVAGISTLFEQSFPVAARFADDECAAQVTIDTDSGDVMLGALGILNGLFGTREDGGGNIVAHVDNLGAIQRFEVVGEPSGPPFKVVPLTPDELAAARGDVLGAPPASAFPIGARVLWKPLPINGAGHRTDVGIVTSYATSTVALVRFSGAGFPGKGAPEYADQTFALDVERLIDAPEDEQPVRVSLPGMCPHNAVIDTNPPACAKCGKNPTTEPSLDDPTTLSAADAYDYRVASWLLEVKPDESLATAVSALRDRVREIEKALVSWRARDAWSDERLDAIARQIR